MEQVPYSLSTMEASSSSSPPQASYAFLNHSTATLPNNLPPSVDNKPLARQKRRRTSPEDQSVLEIAYQRDPKPDQAARLELVKQVALGEKEVQIWFQNRRQSSRRKSRPLLPHEIAQYQMSRSNLSSPMLPSVASFQDLQGEDASSIPASNTSDGLPNTLSSTETHQSETVDYKNSANHEELVVEEDGHNGAADDAESCQLSITPRRKSVAAMSVPQLPVVQVGYLANRRNTAPSRTSVARHVADDHSIAAVATPALAQAVRKSASYICLSMTSDGNARVVTKDTSSPSPPRLMQVAQMLNPVCDTEARTEKHSGSAPLKPAQRGGGSGRSRDSRAWEFWCDKDTRSELEEKAEKDNRGSAADAIGLMRSNSGRVALGAVPGKRNALMPHRHTGVKRFKLDHRKPVLQRSQTSQGRLQGKPLQHAPAKHKLKHADTAVSVYIPGNDSDKENWSPDGRSEDFGSPDSDNIPVDQSLLPRSVVRQDRRHRDLPTAPKASARVRNSNDENADPENDPEVAAFMAAGRKSSSVTQPDEMDCVQGLLSLSQGAWR